MRVSVVTGGGGGMGLACAQQLAARGDGLVLNEIDSSRSKHAVETLRARGASVESVDGDVSHADVARALAAAASEMGAFGALVHTAGLSPTMADGRRILEVNLVGTELLLDAFQPLATPGSVAVCIASQAGHFGMTGATPEICALLDEPLARDLADRLEAAGVTLDPGTGYAMSKLGVIRAAVRLAPAWGARGARIVSLSPGIIETTMGTQEYEAQPVMATMVERTPLGRMGAAAEIASVVEFLCSDAASFITGTDLLVDGGSTGAMRALMPS